MVGPSRRKLGLHLAVLLFGTGLGVLMTVPIMYLAGIVLHVPGGESLLRFVLPQSDYGIVIMLLGLSWAAGIAIPYAVVFWVLTRKPNELSDKATIDFKTGH
jgi:hypothetical protein